MGLSHAKGLEGFYIVLVAFLEMFGFVHLYYSNTKLLPPYHYLWVLNSNVHSSLYFCVSPPVLSLSRFRNVLSSNSLPKVVMENIEKNP